MHRNVHVVCYPLMVPWGNLVGRSMGLEPVVIGPKTDLIGRMDGRMNNGFHELPWDWTLERAALRKSVVIQSDGVAEGYKRDPVEDHAAE